MICHETQELINAYLEGELDLMENLEADLRRRVPSNPQSGLADSHAVKHHRILAALLSFLMPSLCMRERKVLG
jgi:hypothetical protein